MSYGLVVENNEGTVIIGQELPNYGLYLETSVWAGRTDSPGIVNLPGTAYPIVMARTPDGALIHGSTSATQIRVIRDYFGSNVLVELRIFLPVNHLSLSGTHGIVAYDSLSNKTFDSRMTPFAFREKWVTPDPVFGQNYATLSSSKPTRPWFSLTPSLAQQYADDGYNGLSGGAAIGNYEGNRLRSSSILIDFLPGLTGLTVYDNSIGSSYYMVDY